MTPNLKTKPADAEKVARICAIGGGTVETLSQAVGWSVFRTMEAVACARRMKLLVLRRTADKQGIWVHASQADWPMELIQKDKPKPRLVIEKTGPASVWEWAR